MTTAIQLAKDARLARLWAAWHRNLPTAADIEKAKIALARPAVQAELARLRG